MELFYAFGIVCIQLLQDRLEDLEWLIYSLNQIFNPNYLLEYIFPLIATCDSVFGAQLMLSLAFGGWCTTMMKWIMVEDRPFWWVRETSYYANGDRPLLRQNVHTCETGPGSPSGHCAAAAALFMLCEMWINHLVRDTRSRRLIALYSMVPVKTIFFLLMSIVATARMYVGAHFPHQCLMGAILGSIISPSLCLFISDPYLLGNSPLDPRRAYKWHIGMACTAMALSLLLGLFYLIMGVDLHWSTRLAFRWCQSADFINVKASPIFAIVQSSGSLLGWAIAVTPDVANYRHYSRRNSFVAILTSTLAMYFYKHVQDYIPNRRVPFFAAHFTLNLIRPYIYLKLVPKTAVATHLGRPERHPRTPKSAPTQLVASGGVKRD